MNEKLLNHVDFSEEQIKLIRNACCKDASEDEILSFLEIVKKTGLDPLTRQIYLIGRWDSRTQKNNYAPQTSIDGYRLIAQRSQEYEGQTPAYWCGDDGVWKDVWISDKPPVAAKIGVRRKGFQEPVWCVALYKGYAQNNPIWKKMPDLMLAKCAEALALRKAFPQEMAGVYTAEEMPEPNISPEIKKDEVLENDDKNQENMNPMNSIGDKSLITSDEIIKIAKIMNQKRLSGDDIKKLARELYNVSSPRELKKDQFDPFIDALNKLQPIDGI